MDTILAPASLSMMSGSGSVAQRLLRANNDVRALRPIANEKNIHVNATLRKDEWKRLDDSVQDISRIRLVGAADLRDRGLTLNLPNAMGATVYEYEDVSDMNDAQIDMDAVARGVGDRVKYDLKALPLPMTHKSFQITQRVLESSRTRGVPLDTQQSRVATIKVSELIENTLFNGASALAFGGGTLRGYLDFPNRTTATFLSNGSWTNAAKTAVNMLDDVRELKQKSIDKKHYGPWVLYVPTAYEKVLDADYTDTTAQIITIKQRIEQVDGILKVQVADKMPADEIVLVEMTPETIQLIVGQQPVPVEWDSEGGMVHHFKIISIVVPLIRADQDGNSGIVHMTV